MGFKGTKVFVTIALAGSLLVGCCASLPGLGDLITSPRSPQVASKDANTYTAEELAAIVQPLLPQGAHLEKLGQTEGGPCSADLLPVQAVDLSGDGTPEIVAGYRVSQGSVGVLVLQKQGGDWVQVWQGDGGYALDRLQTADITGDGDNELLIGGWIGASAGVGLEILSWNGEGLTTIAHTGYHRLDVEDMPGVNGRDGKAELATWSKDTGAVMMVEVWRWNGEKLVPAKDVYQSYYPKVVDYYQELAQENPQAAVVWYYLADAQLKAGDAEGAMTSAGKGMLFSNSYPGPQRFALLHGQILCALGHHAEAAQQFGELIDNWEKPQGQQAPSHLKRLMAEAYYGRGEARQALGDEVGARADRERARELEQDGEGRTG